MLSTLAVTFLVATQLLTATVFVSHRVTAKADTSITNTYQPSIQHKHNPKCDATPEEVSICAAYGNGICVPIDFDVTLNSPYSSKCELLIPELCGSGSGTGSGSTSENHCACCVQNKSALMPPGGNNGNSNSNSNGKANDDGSEDVLFAGQGLQRGRKGALLDVTARLSPRSTTEAALEMEHMSLRYTDEDWGQMGFTARHMNGNKRPVLPLGDLIILEGLISSPRLLEKLPWAHSHSHHNSTNSTDENHSFDKEPLRAVVSFRAHSESELPPSWSLPCFKETSANFVIQDLRLKLQPTQEQMKLGIKPKEVIFDRDGDDTNYVDNSGGLRGASSSSRSSSGSDSDSGKGLILLSGGIMPICPDPLPHPPPHKYPFPPAPVPVPVPVPGIVNHGQVLKYFPWPRFPRFFRRKRNLCLQPVRVRQRRCSSAWSVLCWWGLRPWLYTYSGRGLNFGRPAADDHWAKVDITFRWKPWKTIKDNAGKFKQVTTSEMSDLRSAIADDPNCIEVYFVNTFSPESTYGGGASFFSGTASGYVISSDKMVDCGADITHLAHELGHVLGLGHPGPGGSLAGGTPGTLMCPSGWERDNPRRQSRENGVNAANPLLRSYFSWGSGGVPECDGAADCGSCAEQEFVDTCV